MSSLSLTSTHSHFGMPVNTISASQLNVQPLTKQFRELTAKLCNSPAVEYFWLSCDNRSDTSLDDPCDPAWRTLSSRSPSMPCSLFVIEKLLYLDSLWRWKKTTTLTHKLYTNYRLSSLVQPMHILLTALCLFSCFINAQGGAAKWLWIKR